jgi:hypothetical protein
MKVREIVYTGQGQTPPEIKKGLSWIEIYTEVHGQHPRVCSECKSAVMVTVQVLPPIRDGPLAVLPVSQMPQKK